MLFLIGVIILISFITICYFVIRIKLNRILGNHGYLGKSLREIIQQARLEDQEEPKSLSSMDSIYLKQIKEDFPDININELKRQAEKVILDCFNAVENKSTGDLTGKIKSFVEEMINDYSGKTVKFNKFKFHNTVVAKYQKNKSVCTIYFASSFEYYLDVDGKDVKTQDRAKVEFIYVIDAKDVPAELKTLDLHCPNCNSPITHLGQKSCTYCGTLIVELIGRIFTCNDIVRY